MKRGKDFRTATGQSLNATTAKEVMALMFVMVEKAPGAFSLRFVSNDDLLQDLEKQRVLQSFLDEVDQLYTDFRNRFRESQPEKRPN